jgi:DNA-binding XRE family transcriptional regulator
MKKTIKLVPYEVFKKQQLKNPEVKRAYDELGPEYALINRLIELRISHGLTQKQLAKKLGTKQSAISRLERGNLSTTLRSFYKIARALDAELKITVK